MPNARCFRLLLLGWLAGCEGAQSRPIVPQSGLRSDVLGCWTLALAQNAGPIVSMPLAPRRIRLDSALVADEGARGRRVLRRLNADGAPRGVNAEGLALHDSWAVDSMTGAVEMLFTDGLAGSTWNMVVSVNRFGVADGMRGFGQGFGDVSPPPPYPRLAVVASREMCAPDTAQPRPR